MDPVALGSLLGIANVLVIALGIAVKEHAGFEGFASMAIIGALPALIAGVLIGAIAAATPRWSIAMRRLVLITPALLIVIGIGTAVGFDMYVELAFLPTIAAALWLERSSRMRELVPAAQAR